MDQIFINVLIAQLLAYTFDEYSLSDILSQNSHFTGQLYKFHETYGRFIVIILLLH